MFFALTRHATSLTLRHHQEETLNEATKKWKN
ncbi:hypothetical protein CCA_00796 [Chlamydia caviae GPIC]|uniref:Uncharacterized protein n=1 Tax=Chlamydia caviae (strain ATCC VR-813 / DSM 19441 / 03DC25 / GPIC) TaxID=227941 RepID=Q821Y9_CHLCV|nr:hypothetical protein CCA_00796 [Chlamydia caviae GPIC]